ncbi:MAG TPA: class I SAM-dependent methyltransferase [Polyangiaceae bacterium]|nr:class I SAM-dependent methyltransferase [Polyangiaceae bacterium]
MTHFLPQATEVPLCPVCGISSSGIEVGTRGRFDMSVRNIACDHCALVYQSPRPTQQAMAEYYANQYRDHYSDIAYGAPSGGFAVPGDAQFEAAKDSWHVSQASKAQALGETKPGDRVLEIGCRHGRTLALMREAVGIEAFGIEPGLAEAQKAQEAGISCFAGTIEAYDPGDLRFDQIQSFHVLEHLHDPLAALIRMRSWLKPGGRMVIEVPNVYQPYGLLEENFFQNAHLTNFSASTLRVLLARAGYTVLRTLDQTVLYAVAVPDEQASELPLPFLPHLLPNADESAIWVADRLKTYEILERLRVLLLATGPTMELLNELAGTLKRPGFIPHTVRTVTEMAEYFVAQEAPRAAMFVAVAASLGPYPAEICDRFQALALRLQAIAA